MIPLMTTLLEGDKGVVVICGLQPASSHLALCLTPGDRLTLSIETDLQDGLL